MNLRRHVKRRISKELTTNLKTHIMKLIDNEIEKISDSNCKVGKIIPTSETPSQEDQAVIIEFKKEDFKMSIDDFAVYF